MYQIAMQSLFYMLAELCRCKCSWAPANRSGLHMAIAIGLGPALNAIGFILDKGEKKLGVRLYELLE